MFVYLIHNISTAVEQQELLDSGWAVIVYGVSGELQPPTG